MEPISVELGASKLQLLAMNALLEHARSGTRAVEDHARVLSWIADMGLRLAADPASVRQQELGAAEASLLCRGGID